MSSSRSEARMIARLVEPKSRTVVGRLYIWETGEAEPMWKDKELLDAVAEPLPGENPAWAKWTLGGPSEPEV